MRLRPIIVLLYLFVPTTTVRAQPAAPPSDSIRLYGTAANSFYGRGQLDSAMAYYRLQRVLIAARYGREDSLYARNSLMIGSTFTRAKHPDSALSYIAESEAIRSKLYTKNSSQFAECRGTLANAEYGLHAYADAGRHYLEAKHILESLGDTVNNTYAFCCNGLSVLATQRGDYEQAEQLAVTTLETRGRLFRHTEPSYAISCMTLARLYKSFGQYEKAEPLYLQAKDIYENKPGRDNASYIECCTALADLYYRMERLPEADTLYLEVKELLERNDGLHSPAYAPVANNLANLYLKLGRWQEAKALEEQAGVIWANAPAEDPNHAIHASTLGGVCMGLGDYRRALALFEQAGEIWKEQLGAAHPYYINNLRNLALANWTLGDRQKADSLYAESIRAKIGAAKKIFLFTNEKEKEAYLESESGTEDEYYSLLWQTAAPADQAYNFALADRNMILSSSRHIRAIVNRSGDSALMGIYQAWIAQKQLLAGLYSHSNPADQGILRQAEDSADRLEAAHPRRRVAAADVPGDRYRLERRPVGTETGGGCDRVRQLPVF